MRNLRQFMLLIMTVSLVTLTSCSSDDDNGGGDNNGGDEFLTANVDGANYAAAQSPSVIVGAQSTNGILAVQGGDNNGNTISMAIQNYNGVGTYTTGDSLTNSNFIQYLEISGMTPNTWASSLATSALGTLMPGTIEITSDDGTTVEGTFTFEGYDGNTVKVITQGEFKAEFDN